MKKLNFACGNDIKKDHVNMDIADLKGIDVTHDFNEIPYPFKKQQFEEIYANHALEHVDDLISVMNEFYRILKTGGRVKVMVPYFASPNADRDPTHTRRFTSETFSYFRKGHYYTPDCSFNVLKKRVILFSNRGFMKSKWYSLPFDIVLNAVLPLYERFFCYLLPASEVHYLLEKN